MNFVRNENGQFAYISVGGENVLKVYTTGEKPELVATIPTRELPHGIWPSGDGTHIYVALEDGTGMNVINTLTNKVEARLSGGQSSQALIYVPNAVPTGEGLDHLEPLAVAGLYAHLVMGAPGTSTREALTAVTLNNQGLIDLLQAAVTGLKPKASYLLALVGDRDHLDRDFQPLTRFNANPAGAAIVNTLGPLRHVLAGSPRQNDRRYLVIVPAEGSDKSDKSKLVQIQLGGK